ncbi:hypothetical protein J2Z70_003067 [Paenibacillus silagei]|uniref:LPXTG cell wall anchor domain-containing protein n=1 Tax=Paenibacillus silagei TaxID=1670801 RepID=A0ABS4NS85_9BACL|nr:hypothetical protein [Paenibacillus silagei]
MRELEYPMEALTYLIVFMAACVVMVFWLKRRGRRGK